MAKFTVGEVVSATGGTLLSGAPDKVLSGVGTDSRSIRRDELFVALRGERFNGHDYIPQAVSAGASAVVCAEAIPAMPGPGVSVIRVADTLKALGDLARFHRQRFQVPVIGITGSNGKTTTKEMIAAILAAKFNIVKTKLNFNNEIGLPLTLMEMDETTEAVVLEMGMRGEGQIRYLAGIARPTIGVVTNVGVTHIELLGSREGIARAKGELIESLPTDGLAVLNGDDPLVTSMAEVFPGRSVFFGLNPGERLDITATEIKPEAGGQRVEINGQWGRFSLFLPLPGRHNVANLLAAAAVGLSLGVSPSEIAGSVPELTAVEKRLRILETGRITVIDDTYNASPPSVKAALEVLKALPNPGRKVAVLGDMLELGPISKEAHFEIGVEVAKTACSALFAFGPRAEETVRAAEKKGVDARHYQDKGALVSDLISYLAPGDAVLIKGSRGLRMDEVVEELVKEGGQDQ